MASFLENFGVGSGVYVYIAVSVSGKVELAIVDPKDSSIKAYAQTELDYNESLREISDYNQFKERVNELFIACNVNPQKVNAHLSLPTVCFGYKENIPLMLDDPAITSVVTGELEQTYIFKRKTPIPYWFDAFSSTNSDSRSVFYTALQEEAKLNIQKVLKELGVNVITIDCSLFSYFRGLLSTNIAVDQMETPGNSWSLLIVNNSGYRLFGMQNKKILEYNEEAIAIRSFDGDELYAEIDDKLQVALLTSASTSLIILSETDLVSAEILAKHVQFAGEIIPVEDNTFRTEPFVDMSENVVKETQIKISLHILGLAADKDILPYKLNFLTAMGEKIARDDVIEIPIGDGKVLALTQQKATLYAGIILGVVLVPCILIFAISGFLKNHYVATNGDAKAKLEQVNSEIAKFDTKSTDSSFDPEKEITNVLRNNRTKIMAYSALGDSIPKELYLTYFMTGDSGYVDIQGCANSVEDVYVFFQNLKEALIESKLRLSKLDLKNGSLDSVINGASSTIDNAPYVFEITNMNDAQLKSFMNALTSSSGSSSAVQNSPADTSGEGANNKAQQAQDDSGDVAAPPEKPAK